MIIKGIGATTQLDRHNCKIKKSVLEELAKNINDGEYAIGVGVEHNHTIMPIGKVLSGELVKLEDGEFGIELTQEIFDNYETSTDVLGNKWYIGKSTKDNRPFADTQDEQIDRIRIAVDRVNFSDSDYNFLEQFYANECNVDSECLMRKSFIPDPEIVLTFVTGTIAALTVKKFTEKISDQISDDLVTFYNLLKKMVIETVKRFDEKNKAVTYVIRESGTYLIELIVVTDKAEVLLEAMMSGKLETIYDSIENFKQSFNFEIAKIQCIYDVELSEWALNYVTTKDGISIGTEKCYKKTIELSKNAGNGLSIGGSGISSEML